jgi:hypothetical protein
MLYRTWDVPLTLRGTTIPSNSSASVCAVCAQFASIRSTCSFTADKSGKFGKFGMANPEDFVGCCNPVNLAIAPDGKVITAEKMISRVKIYEPDGKLLAVIVLSEFLTTLFARLRIDQVVTANWKVILPLSIAAFALTVALGVWVYPILV